uniref:Glutathione peroxidase n=1 Tax=Myxobolus squamalis TaxID=59785 RepID=A0A6B2G498_MYXSQ
MLKEEFGNATNCSFDIVGFPSNQFGSQEPADDYKILDCLKYVRPGNEYQPNFKVFSKIIVNGDDEDPIFTFLKNACPSPNGYIGRQFTYLWEFMRNNDINWNFAKFLLDHNGIPYKRYMPIVHPLRIRNDIQYLIEKCKSEI